MPEETKYVRLPSGREEHDQHDTNSHDVVISGFGDLHAAEGSQQSLSSQDNTTYPSSESSTRGPSAASAKWKKSVQQVMQVNKVMKITEAPGIDLSRGNYDHLQALIGSVANSLLTVYDYCASRVVKRTFQNAEELRIFLAKPKPSWCRVRWVNLQGLSWPYLQVLAQHYRLHPLALEDVVHTQTRTKCDVYDSQLFVALLMVAIEAPSDTDEGPSMLHRTSLGGNTQCTCPDSKASRLAPNSPQSDPYRTHLFDGAKLASKLDLYMEQASLFLLGDSTVVSIFQKEGECITNPVAFHIHTARTLLRDSEDASFLLHSLMDAIVDFAMPVVDQCTSLMTAFESTVLCPTCTPNVATTRELHKFQGQLKQLKRILMPMHYLIQNLHARFDAGSLLLVSQLTRTYLNDIHDHTTTIVETLNDLVVQAGDIEDVVFNLLSHKSNSAMHTLAVVSTVFLPLTFIAGVYGTNFQNFPEIRWEHGYLYFWVLLGLVTTLFVLMLQRFGMLSPA